MRENQKNMIIVGYDKSITTHICCMCESKRTASFGMACARAINNTTPLPSFLRDVLAAPCASSFARSQHPPHRATKHKTKKHKASNHQQIRLHIKRASNSGVAHRSACSASRALSTSSFLPSLILICFEVVYNCKEHASY